MFKNKIEDLRINENSDEFDNLKNVTYLDHAANALYMKSLIHDYYCQLTSSNGHSRLTTSLFSNPHSQSESGLYTNLLVNLTRQKILSLFNTNLNEYDVVFVSNATHACKLIAEIFDFCDRSVFAYLNDSHTSVIGMREIAKCKEANIYCLFERECNNFEAKLVDEGKNLSSEGIIRNLIAIPAQSNFNGRKYELDLIETIHQNSLDSILKEGSQSFVLLDAASYVSTSYLDLSKFKPDFVPISFYKIFGFPTGIGALIIRKTSQIKDAISKKSYFGGGTVSMALIDERDFKFKEGKNFVFHEFLEDGTISYLDIIGVNVAVDKFSNTFGSNFIFDIQNHVQNLTKSCFQNLKELKHSNGIKLVEIYRDSNEHQYGPIIAFNLKNSQNKYIGFNLVDKLAQQNKIHLRVGCFCNIGACQMFLTHLKDNKKFKENFSMHGHKCGDHIDLINGLPTGAIRISFGYCSIEKDIDDLINFLKINFLNMGCEISPKDRLKLELQEQYLKILKLFIYPIKSCAGIEINDSWPLIQSGFVYDRNWIIIDSNQIPLIQKRVPNLARLKPYINLDSKTIELFLDDKNFKMKLDLDDVDKEKIVNVCSHKIYGYDCGDSVSEWLQNALEIKDKCRLIQLAPCNSQVCSNVEQNSLGFKNQGDFLMISMNSIRHLRKFLLHDLKDLLNESEIIDFDNYLVNQFRANIVVDILNTSDDDEQIFYEDYWSHLKILNSELKFIKTDRCSRCQMINLSQSEIQLKYKTHLDLNKLLLKLYNLKSNSKFGIYLSLQKEITKISTKTDQITNNLIENLYEFEKSNKLKCGCVGVATLIDNLDIEPDV